MKKPLQYIDDDTRRSIDLCLDHIRKNHSVAAAYLFGSRARGSHMAGSDADLAVVLNGPKGKMSQVATEIAATEFDVMLETGILVSTLPIWLEDWQIPSSHNNPSLIANIKRDGIPL